MPIAASSRSFASLGTADAHWRQRAGLVRKLAINISLAVQMLAFAEGLLLAERWGVDRQRHST